MRIPKRLVPLIECGIIERVVRPLLSGKEAQVYLVESEGELRAAKVYKSLKERSFKNRASYTEGRKVRNSRDQRAMNKRSRYGRDREEEAWNSAEADMIYKLYNAGVRVPQPFEFMEGVLLMECIEGPNGGPAPRLSDWDFEDNEAQIVFDQLIQEVVRMLCADVVHADLSVYNVLLEEEGPVVIDFPQSIGASQNRHAKRILLRDVANITSHFRLGRKLNQLRFGHEMWDLYERGELEPDTILTGKFKLPQKEIDAEKLLDEMYEIEEEEIRRKQDEDDDFDDRPSSGGPRPRPKKGARRGRRKRR